MRRRRKNPEPLTIALLAVSAISSVVVAVHLLSKDAPAAVPGLAVGSTVRVPLASAQIILATNAAFPIPPGITGIATVLVSAIDGDDVTGSIVSVDSFSTISGQPVTAFLARFSKSAILK